MLSNLEAWIVSRGHLKMSKIFMHRWGIPIWTGVISIKHSISTDHMNMW